MIEGRYVREGNYIEVKLENGLTEIWPVEAAPLRELQVFTLKPKMKKKEKPIWLRALVIASIIVPYSLMYVIGRIYPVNNVVYFGILIVYIAWVVLVAYANLRKKK